MDSTTQTRSTQIAPETAWSVLTDAPLKGFALAREAGVLLAWDEGDALYLLDMDGEFRMTTKAPGRVRCASISDDGSLIAIVGEPQKLWLFSHELELVDERSCIADATTVAIDPHGRYVAVPSRMNVVQFYNRHGKQAGRFETLQPIAHFCFVPSLPMFVGTGSYGAVIGVELSEGESPGKLSGELLWNERLMSSVGRLAVTGDASMILVGCYTLGVQRFDVRGHSEGAYHIGGSASMAVPDIAGRVIGVATFEGELAVLSGGGSVLWRTSLPRPACSLETDALGRFLIHGLPTGEITRVDLSPTERGAGRSKPRARSADVVARAASGPVRAPEWAAEVVPSDDQAEFVVPGILDEPPRVGLVSPKNRLMMFGLSGKSAGNAPEIMGVGRLLRTAPGWFAAATDRQIVLCDLKRGTGLRVDLSLVQVTHLSILPDSFGLAITQEGDRIGRATPAGRWVWRKELSAAVEDQAIVSEGYFAVTTSDGRLRVYDPAGGDCPGFQLEAPDPLCLINAPEKSPADVVWLTLARRSQTLRGHSLEGEVLWESPVAWEGWQLHRVGPSAVILAPDGRAIAFLGTGVSIGESRGSGSDLFCPSLEGAPLRVSAQGVNLLCNDFAGRVAWRAVADGEIGPMAASKLGVAVMIGRRLTWFPHVSTREK